MSRQDRAVSGSPLPLPTTPRVTGDETLSVLDSQASSNLNTASSVLDSQWG